MEAESTLERPEGAVEFDPVSAVDLYLSGVVDPRNAEHHLAFGFAEPFEDPRLDVLGMPVQDRSEGGEDFLHRLMEDRFPGAAMTNATENH